MTADDLLEQIDHHIENKLPLSPSYWVETAQTLVSLMSEETDILHKMQKEFARKKVEWIEKGKSVSESKLRVEAEDIYEFMQNQKAKCERINEHIRLAKIQARMRQNEFEGGSL